MTAVVEQIQLIDLGQLEVHPSNPRKDVGNIDELAASIKSAGLIEPIVAVRHNGTYQVVAGSRRLAAARKAKMGALPVRVMDLDEAQAMAAALIENLQRKDLEPLEQAEAFRGWLDLTGKTQKELAETVGLAPSTIANALRLLEAPKVVKEALRTQTIGAEHARVLLTLKSPELATGVKLQPGVTVEELREDVGRINAEYATKGQGAIASAKKELAEAQAKHPNATITWKAERGYYAPRLVDLTKALGKPPKAICGEMRKEAWNTDKPTEAAHDKACSCQAYQLSVRENYNRPAAAIVFELERVCIDAAGWKKARPKVKRQTAAKKAARERAQKQLTRELTVRKARTAKEIALFKKLLKGSMTADVARAYVATEVIGYGMTGVGTVGASASSLAWDRIAAMPATKVSDLAVSMIAERFADELFRGKFDPESAEGRSAAYFGIEVDAPKKAKKAKR